MFVTSHVLAGAIVGTACRRSPTAAFAVGVVSHVAMDLTPHWGDPDRTEEQFLVVARRDGLLGLGALGAALVAGVPPRRALAAGILGAVLLDLDKPGRHFFGRSPMPAFVDRFHTAIQREAPDRLGLEMLYGAVLAAGAATVLARGRRATRPLTPLTPPGLHKCGYQCPFRGARPGRGQSGTPNLPAEVVPGLR